MNDTMLLSQSEEDFSGIIKEALILNRDAGLRGVARSVLVSSSLVEGCFLTGEVVDNRGRGRLLRAMLRWAVEQLRPDGEPSWNHEAWYPYHVLFHLYFGQMNVRALTTKMPVSESSIYQSWQPKAIRMVAEVLREELRTGRNLQVRRHEAMRARYEGFSSDEQSILRIAALFHAPFPISWLHEIGNLAQLSAPQSAISRLVMSGFLRSYEHGSLIEGHPEMRDYLLTRLLPAERRLWHTEAAKGYLEQEDYLAAASHYGLTGDALGQEEAGQTLVDHQEAIINRLQTNELRTMLADFDAPQLSNELWAQVKLLSGSLAESAEELKVALEEYRQALGAQNVQTRARAYYKRAKAFVKESLDEAQIHFEEAIRLLEEERAVLGEGSEELLADAYIDFAWFFIHERPDHSQAKTILLRAERIIGEDRVRWARLHNAWAGWYAKKKDKEGKEGIIRHRSKALMYANESKNVVLRMKIAKNLGYDYAELRQDYTNALKYTQISLDLAIQTGDQELEGSCHQVIGNCHFWQKAYDEAVEAYHKAYDIFVSTGNQNRQIACCHDLAEAYAEQYNLEEMRRFYNEGRTLAEKMGHAKYLAAFDLLASHYFELTFTLDERLRKLLTYARQHRKIISRKAGKEIGVSRETAVRELNKLCKMGLLEKRGRGPSTHYVLREGSEESG